MKGLWIKFRGKRFDPSLIHVIRPGGEPLSDAQIFQIEALSRYACFTHHTLSNTSIVPKPRLLF